MRLRSVDCARSTTPPREVITWAASRRRLHSRRPAARSRRTVRARQPRARPEKPSGRADHLSRDERPAPQMVRGACRGRIGGRRFHWPGSCCGSLGRWCPGVIGAQVPGVGRARAPEHRGDDFEPRAGGWGWAGSHWRSESRTVASGFRWSAAGVSLLRQQAVTPFRSHGGALLFVRPRCWARQQTITNPAHRAAVLHDELRRMGRYPPLAIDEVGHIPFEPEAANLLSRLVSARYERASLIVTSNKHFGRWGEVGRGRRSSAGEVRVRIPLRALNRRRQRARPRRPGPLGIQAS